MLAREKVPALDVDADQRVPRRPRAREDVPDEVLHEDGRDRRGARQDLDASDVTEVRAQARGADGFSGAASEVVEDAPAVVAAAAAERVHAAVLVQQLRELHGVDLAVHEDVGVLLRRPLELLEDDELRDVGAALLEEVKQTLDRRGLTTPRVRPRDKVEALRDAVLEQAPEDLRLAALLRRRRRRRLHPAARGWRVSSRGAPNVFPKAHDHASDESGRVLSGEP
eukprot:31198-Pelagococcus_subviridis.AAC.19